jgi:hypothetical protein
MLEYGLSLRQQYDARTATNKLQALSSRPGVRAGNARPRFWRRLAARTNRYAAKSKRSSQHKRKIGSFLEQPPCDFPVGRLAAPSLLPEQSFAQYRMHSLLGKGAWRGLVGRGHTGWVAGCHQTATRLNSPPMLTACAALRRKRGRFRAQPPEHHHDLRDWRDQTEAQTTHYIATEYVAGETLRHRLERAPQGRLSLAKRST